MRQISGVLRGEARLELSAEPSVDTASADGVFLAVLRHTSAAGLARQLLLQYQRAGVEAVHTRVADCTVVVHDEAARVLLLARDHVGTTPLHYAAKATAFAFGTRVIDVLERLPMAATPNRAALAALLVDHAAAAPDQSYFADVHSVPPGCTLVRRGSALTILQPPEIPSAGEPATYPEAVAAFGAHLRNAVASRLDTSGPTAVLVSGGLDSSTLLCLAAQHGNAFGITYGPTDGTIADESRYIDVLCSAGLRIERVPFYPTIDVSGVEQSVREGETPVADIVPLTLRRAAAAARELGADSVLLGTWGDQVLAPFPPAHHARAAPWRARALADAYHDYMSDVTEPEIRRALMRQSLRYRTPDWLLDVRRRRRRSASSFDTLAREFAPPPLLRTAASYRQALVAGVDTPAQMEAIAATTKWGLANQIDARLPFLDRELLQYMRTVPDAFVYHQQTLKPLLRDAMKSVVPDAILARRDKGDYTAAIGRAAVPRGTVLDTLDGLRRLVDFGVMSRASAAKTLAQLSRASNIGSGPDRLETLLSVDAWLRIFFTG